MLIRTLILALLFNIGVSDDFVNSETGWDFMQSTSQAFYMFESIDLDGEVAVGDGCAVPECDECYCCQNSGSCDVIGAFFNGFCVGWIYADSAGWTTVPVMGNDGLGDTENYPSLGDEINFIIYDTSEERSYDVNAICQEQEGDCSYQNFGFFMYTSDDYTLDNDISIPETYNILNTYPNPFNPTLNIDFFVESPGIVNIQAYDIMGNLVDNIVTNNFTSSGNHSVNWNAENFASGEYLIRFQIDEVVFATRIVAYLK